MAHEFARIILKEFQSYISAIKTFLETVTDNDLKKFQSYISAIKTLLRRKSPARR